MFRRSERHPRRSGRSESETPARLRAHPAAAIAERADGNLTVARRVALARALTDATVAELQRERLPEVPAELLEKIEVPEEDDLVSAMVGAMWDSGTSSGALDYLVKHRAEYDDADARRALATVRALLQQVQPAAASSSSSSSSAKPSARGLLFAGHLGDFEGEADPRFVAAWVDRLSKPLLEIAACRDNEFDPLVHGRMVVTLKDDLAELIAAALNEDAQAAAVVAGLKQAGFLQRLTWTEITKDLICHHTQFSIPLLHSLGQLRSRAIALPPATKGKEPVPIDDAQLKTALKPMKEEAKAAVKALAKAAK